MIWASDLLEIHAHGCCCILAHNQDISVDSIFAVTPERIKSRFKNGGMLPVDVTRIDWNGLRTDRGTAAADRAINLPTLVARQQPETVRQME